MNTLSCVFIQGGHHSSAVASSASLSAIPVPSAITAVSFPAVRASSVHDLVKRDVCMSSTHAEEFTSACELINRSANSSDQKTLKVRIKVGSDNLSTRKKAEIYSGLGLDVSPSSSLDNSPTDSEGLCLDFQDTSDESPVSILQVNHLRRIFLMFCNLTLSDNILLTCSFHVMDHR